MKNLIWKMPLIIFTIFFCLWCIWHIFEINFYRSKIPPSIGISYLPISIDVNDGILGGWGCVSFYMDKTSIKSIEKEGVEFLNKALSNQHKEREVKYTKWKETPFPKETFSEGKSSRAVLHCNKGFDKELETKVQKALQTKGSYYNDKIVVLPNLGIAIYRFFD